LRALVLIVTMIFRNRTEGVLMGGTPETITDSVQEISEDQDGQTQSKEWIEQAQEEADRQAQEVTELPDQAY
jgi:hypothetical protein